MSERTKAETALFQRIGERRRYAESHEKIAENARGEIKSLQSLCEHRIVKHHQAPCAEAESWNECQVCGAELGD